MNHATTLRIIAFHWHKGADSHAIATLLGLSEATVCDAISNIRAANKRASMLEAAE